MMLCNAPLDMLGMGWRPLNLPNLAGSKMPCSDRIPCMHAYQLGEFHVRCRLASRPRTVDKIPYKAKTSISGLRTPRSYACTQHSTQKG